DFHCLQYTFLAEMNHREDFRERLATLYEEWRSNMAAALALDLAKRPAKGPVSPRALATLVQAILHGLVMQRAADPKSFDTEEMMHLSSISWVAICGTRRPRPRRPTACPEIRRPKQRRRKRRRGAAEAPALARRETMNEPTETD